LRNSNRMTVAEVGSLRHRTWVFQTHG
jgi:hypothetical protein